MTSSTILHATTSEMPRLERAALLLSSAYRVAMADAVHAFGQSAIEIVTVCDEPAFLRAVAKLKTPLRYFRGGLNVFEEIVSTIGEGCTPLVKTFLRGRLRPALVHVFAFGVPNKSALQTIVALGPTVELGCGGGYWARCIAELGGDIHAYDLHEPGDPSGNPLLLSHHDVHVCDAETTLARETDAHALLLCWPPGIINREDALAGLAPARYSPFGETALARFRGDAVAFVGEFAPDFGSPRFFEELRGGFRLERSIRIPNLGAWTDKLHVFRRAKK